MRHRVRAAVAAFLSARPRQALISAEVLSHQTGQIFHITGIVPHGFRRYGPFVRPGGIPAAAVFRHQPERGRPPVRHQLRASLPGHERPAKPVRRCSEEAARGAVPADGGGAGGARRGQGDGLEEGRAQRRVVRGAGGPGEWKSRLAAAPSASAAGRPGAPRWNMPAAPATTAGAGCRLPTWWTSGAIRRRC